MTVSYAVTLYNKAPYIAGVLEAIRAEWSTTGGEILVYDDVSTDGSREIVETLGLPFQLVRGDANVGLLGATQRLVEAISCPFARLVDADDRIRPGSTRHLHAMLEAETADLAFGRTIRETELPDTRPFESASRERVADPFRSFLTRVTFNVSSAMFRTDALKRTLPLPVQYRHTQDLVIGLRIARRGRVCRTDAAIAVAPDDVPGRISARLAGMYREYCLIIADELDRASKTDIGFAVRRNARRCARYFQREAPSSLTGSERLWLSVTGLTPGLIGVERAKATLHRIAGFYAREGSRSLEKPAARQ